MHIYIVCTCIYDVYFKCCLKFCMIKQTFIVKSNQKIYNERLPFDYQKLLLCTHIYFDPQLTL